MWCRPSRVFLGTLICVLHGLPGLADPAAAENAAADAKPAATASAEAPAALASVPATASAGVEAPLANVQATATVDQLHEVLLRVMKNSETLGYQGRYDELSPALLQLFDLAFMAEKSVGRHWKTASPEDCAILVDTFSRYTIANYARRFSSYSGQHFETLGEEPSARDTLLVRTRLVDPDGGDDVNLDYRLRSVDGTWRIIDVYLNGTVSELALRRSEYSSMIKREGFQGLLVALDERIESLATAPADSAS